MSFERAVLQDTGLNRLSRNGDGTLMFLNDVVQATDSNQTLTAAAIAGGLYDRTSITAARTDTTDTAANILAALPQLDVGDNYTMLVSVQAAFALTIAGGTGVTITSTKNTIPASGFAFLMFTRAPASLINLKIL